MTKSPFIHEHALVESSTIGEDSTIWAFSHILKNARLGSNVNVCDHCFIENDVQIGNNVTIKSGVYLWDGITIEDNVFIGPNATFTNDLIPRSKNKEYTQQTTLIKKGATIGANATILPGLTIGEYVMIGAGSVVTKSIPDYTLVFGNPALPKGNICQCGNKITFVDSHSICKCGKNYQIINSIVKQM